MITAEEVENELEKIRPSLQMDGGDVELVDVKNGVVKVKLMGACHGCAFAQQTLSNGIERFLKEKLPEIKKVIAVPV